MFGILIGVLSLVLIGTGLFYFIATTGAGVLEGRRHRRARPDLVSPGVTDVPSLRPTDIYFLVACLNEEAVIGATLTRLLDNDEARVVVVDDASEDRTAQVVRAIGGERTLLISRRLPEARQGKGPALNAGLPAIAADAEARGLDPSRVLVCVMDADGQLSDGAIGHVRPLFDRPEVGGAQLAVRIRNRGTNLLTTIQDFEFWGLSATSQLGRVRLGTVSLGGNGQFTRLSALLGLGHAPWDAALTEDLDLAIGLMMNGWELTTTPKAFVDQQGISSLRGLIRQRTRWFQGHMTCIRHIRPLWVCPRMNNAAVLEVSAYLLIPWVFVLPWSIVFHIGLWEMIINLGHLGTGKGDLSGKIALVLTGISWYMLSFAPNICYGYIYRRQDPEVGRLRAIVLGHILVAGNYIAFISCWLAVIRMLRGRTGWEKTVRRPEGSLDFLATSPLVAPARAIGRLRRQPPGAAMALGAARSQGPGVVSPAGSARSQPLTLRFAPHEPDLVPAVAGSSATATPSPVTLSAMVARPHPGRGTAAAAAALVRARVTRGGTAPKLVDITPPIPSLTGRLRVAAGQGGSSKQAELGARFLIGGAVPDMVRQLEQESA